MAGERGPQRLRALSILRLREYGAHRLANLHRRRPAGGEIDAGTCPRDPRGYFRFFLAIPGNDGAPRLSA